MSIHAVLRDAFAEYELIPWTRYVRGRDGDDGDVLEFDDLAQAEAWLRRSEPTGGAAFLRELVEQLDGASAVVLGLCSLESQLARALVSRRLLAVRHRVDVMVSEMRERDFAPEYVPPVPVVLDEQSPWVEARLRHEPKLSARAQVSTAPLRVQSRVSVQPSRVQSRVEPKPRRVESRLRHERQRVEAKLVLTSPSPTTHGEGK